MSDKPANWPRLLGGVNTGLGLALFLGYWLYLLLPERFATAQTPDPGLILYALATAGAAFVAWGMILRGTAADSLPRSRVMRASAAGFALLGLMRVGTALFPHGPFAQMVALPVAEAILFGILAVILFKSN